MKKKILAIDDNELSRKLIESTLKNDYEVLTLDSGKQILKQLENFLPDLILLDVMMPEKSGYDICSEIKATKEYSHIPVIFLSAKTGVLARLSGYELGAINYVEKPFEVSELKSIIRATVKVNKKKKEVIQIGDILIDVLRHQVKASDELLDLTTREFLILLNLAKKEGVVFTREKLLNLIAPENFEVTDRVIDNQISSIRKKIAGSQIEIETIYGEGYKLIKAS